MSETYESPRVRGLKSEKRALEQCAETMTKELQEVREQITRKQKQINDELEYEREHR